jgi:hypothetical protein
MDVVPHDRARVHGAFGAFYDLTEFHEELDTVGIIHEEIGFVDAAKHHMMKRSRARRA